MSDKIIDTCEVCDGTGKVRVNYINTAGKYVFRKETCYDCKGLGSIEYIKCEHCGVLTPAS